MVAPAAAIAPCTRAEYEALLALLDQEFIFRKGRLLSLERRLPEALDRARPENILVAREHGTAASALTLRYFDWITPGRNWRAAMIGMVYTRPDRRGRGSASALLQAAQARLTREGVEFAVLWTAQPGFYARSGWIGADCGVLGSADTAGADPASAAVAPDAAAITLAEELRQRYAPQRVARSAASYAALPPPAEQLELLLENDACALVGRRERHGYLYEFIGAPDKYALLWSRLSARYRSLTLNQQQGTPSQRWLSAHAAIHWQSQQLAMWLPLSAPARMARFSEWYIPFLDRI
jgi:predicted N-acetyltransferase YhbS